MLPSKILVATDGSEPAKAAVDFAAELALASKAEAIKILSVAQLSTQILGGVSVRATPEHRAHVEEIVAEAAARVKEIVGDATIEVLTEVIEATSVAEAIVDHAAAGAVMKHIVLGDRGLGGLASLILGSVAHHVVQRAHCPVTIVRL